MTDDKPGAAEYVPPEDDGPECDLCGKADCPDAVLPAFSEPRDCTLGVVYDELRYDRCEYGCGRDITKEAIRRAARLLAERVTAENGAEAPLLIAAVRRLHHDDGEGWCYEDGMSWPCDTERALWSTTEHTAPIPPGEGR